MVVLLLYIKSRQTKNDQKKIKSSSPKKKIPNPATTQNNPQKSLNNYKKFCHTPQFFLQVMNKILERKKNNQKKTKQAREKEIMFLFLTPRFRKKKRLQLSCKIQGNTKSKLTRKTKILQKNPMKYTHKKVELKKKNLRKKKLLLPFSFFAVLQLVKLT